MSNTKPREGGENEILHSNHHIPHSIIIVGTETALFVPDSPVRQRILHLLLPFREGFVIVLCRGGYGEFTEGRVKIFPASSLFWLVRALRALLIARSIGKADIVSAQDPFENGLVALGIARVCGAALHVQVHTDFLSQEYVRHSLLNRIRVLLARFVLRRAAGIRVVSERIRTSLESSGLKFKARPNVLPVFVDIERIRVGRKDSVLEKRFKPYSHRVVVVSRLEPEKNIALAIRSFIEAAPETACLIVVGEGSQSSYLKRLVEALGRGRHIFFEGRREALPYYALADLVLVPSRYEGYGLVVVEALAAGKPVLATDVGVVREAGAIIARKEEFAAALASWFRDGPRAGELRSYPYRNFDEYMRIWGDDIAECAEHS